MVNYFSNRESTESDKRFSCKRLIFTVRGTFFDALSVFFLFVCFYSSFNVFASVYHSATVRSFCFHAFYKLDTVSICP